MKPGGFGEPRQMRDVVADHIRRAIVQGRIRPGQRLTERDLSRQMRVSTTPVKEAFRRLEMEGLLRSRPRSGTIVSEFCRQNLEEVAHIRSALEAVTAFLAAKKMSRSDVCALEGVVSRMMRLTAEGTVEELAQANTEFHRTIRKASGNAYLVQVIETLSEFDATFRLAALTDKGERERGLEEHVAIVRAIVSGDATGAEDCMRRHVQRSAAFVLARAAAEEARRTSAAGVGAT